MDDQDRVAIPKALGNLHDHFQGDCTDSDKYFVENQTFNHQNVAQEDSSDGESIIILDENEKSEHDELIIDDSFDIDQLHPILLSDKYLDE